MIKQNRVQPHAAAHVGCRSETSPPPSSFTTSRLPPPPPFGPSVALPGSHRSKSAFHDRPRVSDHTFTLLAPLSVSHASPQRKQLVWRFCRWWPPSKTSEDALVSLRQDKNSSCTANACLVLCLTCVLEDRLCEALYDMKVKKKRTGWN